MKTKLQNIIFPILGLISLIWILIRVIQKPSRASYPCIQAAAPIASSFVLYILAFLSSLAFLRKARKFAKEKRYILFSFTLFVGLSLGFYTLINSNSTVYANYQVSLELPNTPMGSGIGVYPGRVAWIFDPEVTDETCQNIEDDYWWQDSNTNQQGTNNMLSDGLQLMTGQSSDTAAWNMIFRDYNQNHEKGEVGYTSGEKIVIKINLNNDCRENQTERSSFKNDRPDTSPQLVYALLNQLINTVGVAQSDISVGDPGKNVGNIYYNKCTIDFPNVNYWGVTTGRTAIVRSENIEFYNSDGTETNYLPESYLQAEYMINAPILKKHHRGGVSLTAKNHFGTFVPFRGSASHMHPSLPAPDGSGDVSNGEYGVYRCFVDIMGHKDLGGKTILYIVDGLWGSTNWGHPAIKWQMAPFNNDWPSSLFLSQDPVAIESVCFDFLYEEFDLDHPTEGTNDPGDNTGPFPHYAGVDDYLHQAADSANWPDDIEYDPENDGSILPASLGVHEHWDNAVSKNYSRNFGYETGIELVSNIVVTDITEKPILASDFQLSQNYPNPFNRITNIWYYLGTQSQVQLTIYNSLGQVVKNVVNQSQSKGEYLVKWDGLNNFGKYAPSAVYFYELNVIGSDLQFNLVKKMVYVK